MSCCPSADIALPKESRDQYPRVLDDLFVAGEIERDRHIETLPDAAQPALLGPARQHLGRGVAVKVQRARRCIDGDHLTGGAEDRCKACARGRQWRIVPSHDYTITWNRTFKEFNASTYSAALFEFCVDC